MKYNNIKALRLIAGFTLVANMASADLFTIGGFTFNDDNSVTTAVVVEGGPNLNTHSAPLFAGVSDPSVFGPGRNPGDYLYFKRERTIGRLLGGVRKRRSVSDPSLSATFPSRTGGPPWANVDRCTIELTWSGKGLRNKPGPDFVVYEVGTSEAFAVSVRRAGSDTFTQARSKFATKMDLEHNTVSVPFDLSSFSLSEGEIITAIRIRNMFNSEASAGADKVDHASGEGGMVYPGDPGYASAHRLTGRLIGSDLGVKLFPVKTADEGGGREFGTDSLDPDFVFVVGLHNVEPLPRTPALAGQLPPGLPQP